MGHIKFNIQQLFAISSVNEYVTTGWSASVNSWYSSSSSSPFNGGVEFGVEDVEIGGVVGVWIDCWLDCELKTIFCDEFWDLFSNWGGDFVVKSRLSFLFEW